MLQTNRRTTLKLLGGAALAVAVLPVLPLTAAAQEDLVVPNSLQNFKRGTIHSMHPEVRSFTIVWQDLGRVKMKAADLVTNYNQLANIVERAIEAVIKAARTGKIGDGKIFVTTVEQVVRIRTGESGEAAV